MKYSKRMYIFLILILMLISSSCNGIEKKEYAIGERVDLHIDDILDPELSQDWNTKRYKLSNLKKEPDLDYYISSGSQAEDYIYYISSGFKHMSNDCMVYEILRKDINTGEIKKIYEDSGDRYKQVSVMKYANDNLFWVEENTGGWSLIKFDLKEEVHKILDSSDTNLSTLSPNIEACEGSLFWHVISEDRNIRLFEYSILDDKIKEHKEENLYLESPFNTVRCSQGHMTYLTKEDMDIIINIRSEANEEFSTIKTDSLNVVYAISNDQYVIWLEGRHNSTLNIYEVGTTKLKSIECSKNNIRSIAINGSNILIDFSTIYMEGDSEYPLIKSGVFEFDFNNSSLRPIYMSEKNETIAWIDGNNGHFSINSWHSGDEELISEKLIFTYKDN